MEKDFRKNMSQIRKRLCTDGKCVYCGNTGHLTADHVIPLSVYKWTKIGDPKDYNSDMNIVVICEECNLNKGCAVPSKAFVAKVKPECLPLYNRLIVAIHKYCNIRFDLYKKQNSRCGYCRRRLHLKTAIIRRKDQHQPRCFSNAILLCSDCGENWRWKRRSYNRKHY